MSLMGPSDKPSRRTIRILGVDAHEHAGSNFRRHLWTGAEVAPPEPMPEARPERDYARVTAVLLVLAFLVALAAVATYASTLLSFSR